jgi:hypothetical protein
MTIKVLGLLALIALSLAASAGWAQTPNCPASVITECQNSSKSACVSQCKSSESNCDACTDQTFQQCVKSKGYSWCPVR